MGIFSAILEKLRQKPFERDNTQMASNRAQPSGQQQPGQQQQFQPGTSQPGAKAGAGAPMGVGGAAQNISDVDVEAVLTQMAAKKGGGGNWRTSIVDLLKLLDLDSSLNARKELASELGVQAGEHGSAEQNIALHKAVMRKLAENGGRVPASLKD